MDTTAYLAWDYQIVVQGETGFNLHAHLVDQWLVLDPRMMAGPFLLRRTMGGPVNFPPRPPLVGNLVNFLHLMGGYNHCFWATHRTALKLEIFHRVTGNPDLPEIVLMDPEAMARAVTVQVVATKPVAQGYFVSLVSHWLPKPPGCCRLLCWALF